MNKKVKETAHYTHEGLLTNLKEHLTTKNIMVAAGLFLAVILVVAARGKIVEAWQLLGQVNLKWLYLAFAMQIPSYYFVAKTYQALLATFGTKTNLKKMFELSLALNFVNSVAPSAGVSGTSYFSYVLSRDKVPVGKSALVQVAKFVLTFSSFILILLVGGTLLYFSGDIQRITVRIILLMVAAILVLCGGFIFAMLDRKRLDAMIHWLTDFIDKISGWVRKDNKPLIGRKKIEDLLNEFHGGFALIMGKRRRIIPPFMYVFATTFMEIATVYLVFVAFSSIINPGIVIIAYGVANIAGVNFLPAGVGSYEAAMVAIFAATGTPVALALSATLVYRVVNMVLYLPVGFYFYQKNLVRKKV
ncbi:MAG: lysylphosphatidylglycerol synthase transmembrane domain-containing protein [Candidatus Saccharimonadales bacterium]